MNSRETLAIGASSARSAEGAVSFTYIVCFRWLVTTTSVGGRAGHAGLVIATHPTRNKFGARVRVRVRVVHVGFRVNVKELGLEDGTKDGALDSCKGVVG